MKSLNSSPIRLLHIFFNRVTNPLKTDNPFTGTLANREDPDEMPLHLGLYGLHMTKLIIRERNIASLETITCDPSIYTMDHTVKPVLRGHSKRRSKIAFKTNYP